jgi:hypothetical protein
MRDDTGRSTASDGHGAMGIEGGRRPVTSLRRRCLPPAYDTRISDTQLAIRIIVIDNGI